VFINVFFSFLLLHLDIGLKDLFINDNMTTLKALSRSEKAVAKIRNRILDYGLRWVVLSSNECLLPHHIQHGTEQEPTRLAYNGLSKHIAEAQLIAMRNRWVYLDAPTL